MIKAELQLSFFTGVALFLLSWGLTLQVGRFVGWNLVFTGNVASIFSFGAISIYFLRFYRFPRNTRFGKSLLAVFPKPILLLALALAGFRFFHFSESSDALQYLIGAAHHSGNFASKLGFDMPGHVGSNILNLYHISQVLEYLAGYLSYLTSYHIVTVYFHFFPAVIVFLAVLSLCTLFSTIGCSQRAATLYTVVVVCLLLFNFGDGYFGEWAIRRTETPRACFNAFILNIILSLVFFEYCFKKQLSIKKLLILSSGFCMTSQTLPFLLFAATILIWTAVVLQNSIMSGALKFGNVKLFVPVLFPAFMLILISHYFNQGDIYEYQLEGWEIRELPNYMDNFGAHLSKVYGENRFLLYILGTGIFFQAIMILGDIIFSKKKNLVGLFLFFYGILYAALFLNPYSFNTIDLLSAKSVVFFRFFYTLSPPVYLILAIAIYSHFLRSLKFHSVTLALSVVAFSFFGLENFIKLVKTNQFKKAEFEQAPIISYDLIEKNVGEHIAGKTLLAFRQTAFRHGVYSPNLTLLVSKNQFLPLYRTVEEARVLDAAQFALGGSWKVNKTHIDSLEQVFKSHYPDIVVAKNPKSEFVDVVSFIMDSDYKLLLQVADQLLFVRNCLTRGQSGQCPTSSS
ncbi:hypothetical protein GN278_06510 [Rhodobacteraceae bacterium Araon29]